MTNLYEAGDVNTVDGDDELDINAVDDVDDVDDIEDGNESGDDGNEPDAAFAGGTPLAVLTYLARSLSNDPDAVVIETEERRGGLRLSLHVAPDDMGRRDRAPGQDGPGHPHPGERGRRQGRRAGQRGHRRRLTCSKSVGSPRPTVSAARSSSSSGRI